MSRIGSSVLLMLLAGFAGLASSQSLEQFEARLSWVPVALSELRLVAGEGAATAALTRNTLAIFGEFSGLAAGATAVRLHRGVATGASGPEIADIPFTLQDDAGTAGAFSGAIDLGRADRDALLAGQLYIQIYADPGVPPDNSVLRGWLLGSGFGAAGRK